MAPFMRCPTTRCAARPSAALSVFAAANVPVQLMMPVNSQPVHRLCRWGVECCTRWHTEFLRVLHVGAPLWLLAPGSSPMAPLQSMPAPRPPLASQHLAPFPTPQSKSPGHQPSSLLPVRACCLGNRSPRAVPCMHARKDRITVNS